MACQDKGQHLSWQSNDQTIYPAVLSVQLLVLHKDAYVKTIISQSLTLLLKLGNIIIDLMAFDRLTTFTARGGGGGRGGWCDGPG